LLQHVAAELAANKDLQDIIDTQVLGEFLGNFCNLDISGFPIRPSEPCILMVQIKIIDEMITRHILSYLVCKS
jgi:hypothetical protein